MDWALQLKPPELSKPEPLRCCCEGDGEECDAMRHNCSVVDGLNKDARHAAQMGQTLVTYLAKSARDREEVDSRIAELEAENSRLETLNAQTAAENRSLLAQLETLSSNIVEADTRIHTLEASLKASQQSERRLEIAAGRAEEMERHIARLEEDLEGVHGQLAESEEDAREKMNRWRAAERAVQGLQDEMRSMEKAAREDAERQAGVIARLERQRELSSAAVRLKGAAAVKSIAGTEGSGSGGLACMMRDLINDNLQLQASVLELREQLGGSRDEIQSLRERLDEPPAHMSMPSPLRDELDLPASPPKREEPSRQVHIHHHYHAAPKERKKKRRSAQFITPLSSRVPSRAPSVASGRDDGWRELEDSLASSPQSDPRMSVFDKPEEPLSPSTSVGAFSPVWKGKRPALPSSPVVGMLDEVADQPVGLDDSLAAPPDPARDSGVEVSEMDTSEPTHIPETGSETPTAPSPPPSHSPLPQHSPPRLRRAQSHESVVSLGGLDIHTLRNRPSQLTLGKLGAQAQLAVADVTALPTISRVASGSAVLRDSLAKPSRPPRTVSKKWSWRPWGGTEEQAKQDDSSTVESAPVAEDSKPRDVPVSSVPKGLKDGGRAESYRGSLRAAGINQPGAIPGFGEFIAQSRRRRGEGPEGNTT